MDLKKPLSLTITEDDAAELRKGNSLRVGVMRIGDRVLEVVISSTWEPGEPNQNDYSRADDPDPLYEVSASEWSVYSTASLDEAKPLWRGTRFGVKLEDILAS